MPFAQFHIPRRERLGIIVWTLIALLVWWLPQWYPEPVLDYEFLPVAGIAATGKGTVNGLYQAPPEVPLRPFDPNTVTQQELVAFGLPERAARGWVNYRNAAGDYADLAALQRVRSIPADALARLEPYLRFPDSGVGPARFAAEKTTTVVADPAPEPEYFDFDPNTVTEPELRRLGLTEREASSLLRYRAAGARFRQEADWLRVRAVPVGKLTALLPFLEIDVTTATPPDERDQPAEYGDTPREVLPIDINRADAAAWRRLPGIGDYWSGRILAFRLALGGFVSVQQVAETRGLPDSVFQRIRDHLQPGELLARIPINSITEEELARHPYLTRRQATVLIAFRTQRGRLTEEDFRNFKAMNAADRERILPYLSF